MRQPKAFTLIELLVVVTIIIVLLAMLGPSMNRALEATLDAQCSANLRQTSVAILDYAGDHLGQLYWNGNPNASHDETRFKQGPDGNWKDNESSSWLLRNYFVGPGYLPTMDMWGCPLSGVPSIDSLLNTRSWSYGSYSYWPLNGNPYPNFGTGEAVPHRVSKAQGWVPLIQDALQDRSLQGWEGGWKANHTTGNYRIATAMENVNPSNVNRRTIKGPEGKKEVRGGNIATFDGSVRWYDMDEMQSAGPQPSWPQRVIYSAWIGN